MQVRLPLLLAGALALLSCFSPDLTKRTIRCDTENPCPEQEVCLSGICALPGELDLSMSSADLARPDLTGVGPSGCMDGNGTYLGGAWACPGLFGAPSPTASMRCAAGWVPCLTVTGVSLASCKALSGFFVANYVGKASGNVVTCTPPSGGNRGIFGCGTGGIAQAACMGFDQALVCSASPDWQCADQLELIRSNNVGNGVLCCKS